MFRATRRLLSPQSAGVDVVEFKRILEHAWQGQGALTPARVGIAVSGGVDSMALVTLCAAARKTSGAQWPTFTAFVVDHKLRDDSTDEAHKVLANLASLDIDSQLLTLDWTGLRHADGIANVESAARRLRYQALGKACRDAGARHLLVGHHADDQAESVLVRIVSGRLGAGLAGMRSGALIPECEDVYGVSCSEMSQRLKHDYLAPITEQKNVASSSELTEPPVQPVRLSTVGDGIRVLRPLLSYNKQRLIDICISANTAWFEDQTNADQTLALRNTIRPLHATEALPLALRRSRLLTLARNVRTRQENMLQKTRQLFDKANVRLDPRAGSLTCTLSLVDVANLGDDFSDGLILFLRKMLNLVTPQKMVDRAAIYSALSNLLSFAHTSAEAVCKVSVAGVTLAARETSASTAVFTMHRQMPSSISKGSTDVLLKLPSSTESSATIVTWSSWHLWDNRYWIRLGRVGASASAEQYGSLRFFTPADMTRLRRPSLDSPSRDSLRSVEFPLSDVRYTIPVICIQHAETLGGTDVTETIIAMPSIGWSRNTCQRWTRDIQLTESTEWVYDIKYKYVDASLTEAVDDVEN
ncbi:hypothetical protein B0A48_05064 [Cryoendolithus antarcticus]|uniref:tRNA(Ile)-lysidine synthetase n=1 Tax=Cryoendolithus antarcticus TaxID=1507870 RepID=A0A1V8TEL6_9PEZI|nr:hypothetical protein B0A48_05064 [Cryoendolithus antarcticus]